MAATIPSYITIYENSLSKSFCDSIIQLFKTHPSKQPGSTLGGVDIDVKDTTDLRIISDDQLMTDIHQQLSIELYDKLAKYISTLNKQHENINYIFFSKSVLEDDGFQIQKYTANKGKYICHVDTNIMWNLGKYRVLAFIWYLNDVTLGGETEFGDNYLVKPETGKLIFFPACWSFPHKGNIPISEDKYIITGWIYSNPKLYEKMIQTLPPPPSNLKPGDGILMQKINPI